MTADEVYRYALQTTLVEEGGYSNHPDDPGKATMRGITQETYDAYRLGKGLSPQDVALIEEAELQEIYFSYWEAIRGDSLPPAIAVVAFDIAVNSGPNRLLEWLAERPHDAVTLSAKRMEYFTNLKELWPIFGRGWSRRTTRVLEAAHALTART